MNETLNSKWNIREFRALCEQANNEGVRFAESLSLKFIAARDYHHKNILQKLKEAKEFKDLKDLTRLDFEIACEMDAFMNALNSTFDLLAQLVNECLRSSKSPAAKIEFHKISKWDDVPEGIRCKVARMAKNEWFLKIRDYCNVSKHHQVIKGDVHVEFLDLEIHTGYHTKEFNYRKRIAQSISDRELDGCLKFVGRSVNGIGVILNQELLSRSEQI